MLLRLSRSVLVFGLTVASLFSPTEAQQVVSGTKVKLTFQSTNDTNTFLGTNLTPISDWSTEYPFLNVAKTMRPWVSRNADTGMWGDGRGLNLDSNGYVISLSPKQEAVSVVMMGENSSLYSGSYVFSYTGDGVFKFFGAVTAGEASREGDKTTIPLTVGPDSGGVFFYLTTTDPSNYPKNIKIYESRYTEAQVDSLVFNPAFVSLASKFSYIRFMDWLKTNNSPNRFWEQRPKVEDCSWSSDKGVPYEICLSLTSKIRAVPWLCIPHQADAEYVAALAELLATDREIYVELSNEVWNGIFNQHQYFITEAGNQGGLQSGLQSGLQGDAFLSAMTYHALLGSEFSSILKAKNSKIKFVQGGFIAWPWGADQVLGYLKANGKPLPDSYAIAAYFGGEYGNPDYYSIQQVLAFTPVSLVESCISKDLPGLLSAIDAFVVVGNKYGVKITGYEGGQHMVGVRGQENNAAINVLFDKANRTPRISEAYFQLAKNWQIKTGGSPLCFFNLVEAPSKYGRWGMYTSLKDTTSNKARGIRSFVKAEPRTKTVTVTIPWDGTSTVVIDDQEN